MVTLKGVGGSRGYASGTAVIKREAPLVIPTYAVADTEGEIRRFLTARKRYDARLAELCAHTASALDAKTAEIFGAYRIILHDDIFFNRVFERVEQERLNIEHVLGEECRAVMRMFEAIDDPYLRERGTDIENVCMELIRIMTDACSDFTLEASRCGDIILVAGDLSPAETVKLDKSRLRGIVTARGGATSHTVILARALGIPAVVGVEGALEQIRAHSSLLLDAERGEVAVDPDEGYRSAFFALLGEQREHTRPCESAPDRPCETLDGFRVNVDVNTGDAETLRIFSAAHCDGVGLYRTEFLYMGLPDYPDEEAQYAAYSAIAVRAEGKKVVIRTLDAGGDKRPGYMNLPKEENPALGLRAIRLSLSRPDVFHTQLRAILRAALHGDIRILFPMIVTPRELLSAKAAMAEAAASLAREGALHRADIPIGVMIETPAAVMLADKLAQYCDFFSIGVNDLIQYTAAADRQNRHVAYLYDCANIAVLRSIQRVAEAARAARIPWGICGEAAAEELLIPLWIAMGANELSAAPSQVKRIRHLIRRLRRGELIPHVQDILDCAEASEARHRLEALAGELEFC